MVRESTGERLMFTTKGGGRERTACSARKSFPSSHPPICPSHALQATFKLWVRRAHPSELCMNSLGSLARCGRMGGGSPICVPGEIMRSSPTKVWTVPRL